MTAGAADSFRKSRGGQTQRIKLLLNQVANEVEGSVSLRIDAGASSPNNTEILDGKVENDTLPFMSGPDGPAREGLLQRDVLWRGDQVHRDRRRPWTG
jgi:hypothetical protein